MKARYILIAVLLTAVLAIAGTAKTALPAVKCTDTDGGKDFLVKGYINSYDSNGAKVDGFTDNCWNGKLREGYCESYKIKVQEYICPYGCSGGVCQKAQDTEQKHGVSSPKTPAQNPAKTGYSVVTVPQITNLKQDRRCIDTDGGKDYNSKGYVNVYSAYDISNKLDGFTDNCWNGKLKEGYCENNAIKVDTKSCPKGCLNGACK